MRAYISECELKNVDNMQQITDILDQVPESDLHFQDSGEMTLDEAVQKIRELGEDKIADLLCDGGNPL